MDAMLLQASQQTPFSAFALCYIPLAVVVLGLLALFFMTDEHARRPYLRSNPYIAASATPQELEQRQPATGETPAGSLGAAPAGDTMVFDGEMSQLTPVTADGIVDTAAVMEQPPADPEAPQSSLEEGIGELSATPLDQTEDTNPNAPKPLGPGDKIL